MLHRLRYTKLTKGIHTPDFTIFRWAAGIYLLILGISLLILPQGNLGIRLTPVWLYASATFFAGLIVLWLAVLKLAWQWRFLISMISILPLLASGWAYVQLNIIPGATVFFVLSIGILWAAFVPAADEKVYRPDAMGITLGILQFVQGFYLIQEAATPIVPPASGIPNIVVSLLFLGGGLGVILTQLISSIPSWLRKVAHGISGLTLLGLLILQAIYIDPLYWILGAAVMVRSAVTILLPWYGDAFRRIDSSALRPRLALGLVTAATLPALISITVFLNVVDEQLIGRHFSRPVLFGVVLLFALASGIAAWWFANKLTAPLTALVSGVPRIPKGQYVLEIPKSGVTEIANLEAAIENMSQTIVAQTVEREQLITQLQSQNHSLGMLEKSFRMVAENATELISRFDADLRHTYVNPAVKRAIGMSPELFLGKSNRDLGMPEVLVQLWDEKINSVFSSALPTTLEFSFVLPTGEQRLYQSNLVPETDEDGTVISVLSVAHDVTDLKLAQQHTERALQAMLAMARTSTTNSPNTSTKELLDAVCEELMCEGGIMVILVPETQVIHDLVTTGFEAVSHTILERVRGQQFQTRFDDPGILPQLQRGEIIELDVSRPPYVERQPRPGLQKAFLVPMRVAETLWGIITLYPKEETPFNKEEWSAIASASGNLAAILLERERLSAEREEAQAVVLAAQKTARYNQELERINQELRLFSHIVSHDFHEPLRMITSYLQLIERRYTSQLDMDAKEFITFALDGSIRMKMLLDALLSYTRVGAKESVMVTINMYYLLQTTIRDLSLRIDETNAVIFYDKLPTITADKQQMGQLFQNLINNALKFRHPDRECQIEIGAERQDNGYCFWVRDNGIGIDPKNWERIFLIFQRLHTANAIEGTGIGLSICKKIVERHRGKIWVESEVEHGSTFFFTIPDHSNETL